MNEIGIEDILKTSYTSLQDITKLFIGIIILITIIKIIKRLSGNYEINEERFSSYIISAVETCCTIFVIIFTYNFYVILKKDVGIIILVTYIISWLGLLHAYIKGLGNVISSLIYAIIVFVKDIH